MPRSPTIQVSYPQPAGLLEQFRREGPGGVLFIETGRRFHLGQPLIVAVRFPTAGRSFRLRGTVIAARRGSREPPLPAGVEVSLPSDQQRTLRRVLDCAEGKQVDFVDRRDKRVACAIEVTYRTDAGFVREFAEDISAGGTFVRSERLFAEGAALECKLKPPGYLMGIRLRARVAWVKSSGEDRGMGLEFQFDSARQRRRIRSLCQRLAAEHKRQLERGVQAFKQRDRSRSRGRR